RRHTRSKRDWSSDVCSSDLERAYQLEGTGQWMKGKSADTFGPIGPWLVTPDEIADWSDLRLWLEVNGRRVQNGSTKTMVFSVPRSEERRVGNEGKCGGGGSD